MNHTRLIAAGFGLLTATLLVAAPRRKTPSAAELLTQAREAFYAYNPTLAKTKIGELRRLRKGVDTAAVDSLGEQVDRMESMIQRVEDIQIIDSVSVSRDDFFRNYRLAPAAGSLLGVDEAGGGIETADSTVVYMPESGALMLWGGPRGLMESRRLTDGSWEEAEFLGEELNAGGTANFPFLMPDGVTLYYAADGDDSLGGLDLYISRRNRDGFPAPQNMGMPYNSPYDDYMLAIDEETGAGWWASDRNRLDGLVTIYVFIPGETRVNLDVNDPALADRARAFNLADNWGEMPAREPMLQKIASITPATPRVDNTPDFTFDLPDGRVLTRWSDFRNPQARRLMENYVDALADYEAQTAELERLRAAFGGGNRNVASKILNLEKKTKASQIALRKLSNQIVSAEMK